MSVPVEIGWTVTDPEGNVVSSGSITQLEMTSDLAQALEGL